MLAATHLGGGHLQRSGRLGITVRLSIGESEPILQHSAIKIIEVTEQLRSQHLAVDPVHTGELLGTITSTIVVEGG